MFPGLKRRNTRLQRPCGDIDIWASGVIARPRDLRDSSRTPRSAVSHTTGVGHRPNTRHDQPMVLSKSGSSREEALSSALTTAGREAAIKPWRMMSMPKRPWRRKWHYLRAGGNFMKLGSGRTTHRSQSQ